jgi:hypothetical protein
LVEVYGFIFSNLGQVVDVQTKGLGPLQVPGGENILYPLDVTGVIHVAIIVDIRISRLTGRNFGTTYRFP